ncbi:MAG: hypothetical protein GKC01_04155 [Candidatus Methanofastidiosa archaeon]|nr:hypothetical protein [Candidatus Methanofastidiosa archaeon]
MRKSYLTAGFIIILVSLSPIFGQDRDIIWEQRSDGGLNDMAYAVSIDSEDNVIVTGTSRDMATRDRDFYTIKYDKTGKVIWERRYDVGIRDESYGIDVDSKDNIVIVGTASGKYFIIKYDKDGELMWTDSPNRGNDDVAYDVAIDSEDNILITGRTKVTVYNYYTLKYDKDGKMLWKAMWTGGEDDVPYGIAIDSKDNIIVTGFSSNGQEHRGRGDYTYYTFKYDKDGNKLWHGKWATSYPYAEAFAVTTDSKDNVVVTGFVMIGTDYHFCTIKSDSTGKIIWDRVYERSSYDRPYDVIVDLNDNIIVTGTTRVNGLNYGFCTIKYDPQGELLWEKIYVHDRNDQANGVAIDSENNIIVTGGSDDINWDFLTVKYENN